MIKLLISYKNIQYHLYVKLVQTFKEAITFKCHYNGSLH